jgi:saccharopine dehydrogenase (NAD+, L-lysine forming)
LQNSISLSQRVAFGVVGGYGATGKVVASELWKCSDGEILVAGRDLEKAKALAAQFDGKVSATPLDVMDASALDAFCQRCSIIINCAGPVMLLRDRVAQAAVRNKCHYVDPAGLGLVKERILPSSRDIESSGLSFIISAGWMPGISELVPAYAEMQARTTMDSIDCVTVCFGDSGEWSDNALRDAAWFVHQSGLRSPGYFHRGGWARAKVSMAFRKINLGKPVGSRRFGLVSMPELNEIGRRLKDCDFFSYAYLSGLQTAIATTAMAVMPLPESVGVPLMRNVFRRNRLPVDGFAWARIIGHSGRDGLGLTVQVVYRERRDYSIHGLALATVARMIFKGKGVKPGVHYVADSVDSAAFMAELRKAGVEQTQQTARLTVRVKEAAG